MMLRMDFYHALNRGVEKRNIFMDVQDYLRFVHDMYEFNDATPANNVRYHLAATDRPTRKRLVDIHGWCLMKNHYHLLLSERAEGGMSLFLRKLNVGYAKYFNQKYKRTGVLFQGRTKKIPILRDQQFNYILHYIHLNPLDYLKGEENWRIRSKGKTKQSTSVKTYLSHYRWSSYLDYVGQKNFSSILTTDFFGDAFGNYEKALMEYLKGAEKIESTTLE